MEKRVSLGHGVTTLPGFILGGGLSTFSAEIPNIWHLKGWAKPRGSAFWGRRLSGGEGQGQCDSSSGSEGKGGVKCFLVVSPSPEQG